MRMYNFVGDITLPSYLKVQVETRGESKYVIFHSQIHVNATKEIPFCFSSEFTDLEILKMRDVVTKYINYYGG